MSEFRWVAQSTRVLRFAPATLLSAGLYLSQCLAPRTDILDEGLNRAERVVERNVTEDAAAEDAFGPVHF
jgi:hypothetical protein